MAKPLSGFVLETKFIFKNQKKLLSEKRRRQDFTSKYSSLTLSSFSSSTSSHKSLKTNFVQLLSKRMSDVTICPRRYNWNNWTRVLFMNVNLILALVLSHRISVHSYFRCYHLHNAGTPFFDFLLRSIVQYLM